MTSLAHALPVTARRAPRRRALLFLTGVLLTGAAVLAVVLLARGGDGAAANELRVPGRFALTYPAGWHPVSAAALRSAPGKPVAALRRADGAGVVTVHAEPPLRTSLGDLAAGLTRELARRVPDLRPVAARTVRIRAGRAFAYTFARPSAHRVQSIVVATVGGRTYALDAASAAGDARAAREAAAILASFGGPA